MEINKITLQSILRARWDKLIEHYIYAHPKKMRGLYFGSLSEIDALCQCFNIPPFYPGEFNDYINSLDEAK